MEKRLKRTVHISWEEAYRAEAEREKARQMRCLSIPPTQSEFIADKIVTRLYRIKASAKHFASAIFNRVRISSCTPANYHSRQLAVAITLGIILLVGGGILSYSKNSESELSEPVGTWKGTPQVSQHSSPEAKVMPKSSKEHLIGPSSTFNNDKSVESDAPVSVPKTSPGYSGNFEVINDSFVRDQPEPDATIIATLRPGTQVRIETKTGDYLRVRSLSDADVIGYVHEEDAFFQAR
jgi:hypothetical protein